MSCIIRKSYLFFTNETHKQKKQAVIVSQTDSTKYKVRGYNGLLCPTNHVSNDQGYTLPAMNDQQIYGRVQLNRIFKL